MPAGRRKRVADSKSRSSKNSKPKSHDDNNSTLEDAGAEPDPVKVRAALLQTVRNYEAFASLFVAHGSSSSLLGSYHMNIVHQRKLLLQTIVHWDNDTSSKEFFSSLQMSVEHVLEHQLHIPESAFATDQDDDHDDPHFVITPDERSDMALIFLRYAATCVLETLESKHHSHKQQQYPIVRLLHDALDELDASCGPSAVPVVLEIVKLCEKWWLCDGGDSSLRETVILNALPHIVRTYQFSRIYAVRHALELVDWNHLHTADPEYDQENQKRFLHLVMGCVSQPKLKNQTHSEGIRLVSYLLSILPEQTHNSIRSQLPDTSRAMAKAYGHIYYRAMNAKDASENQNDGSTSTIAEFLTELVYAILHVENTKLYLNLKILLQPFHKEPTFCDTFYGPLLFRNMASANPKVRARAIQVLEELHLTRTQLELAVQKLLDDGLLVDTDERVRMTAGSTAAHILQRYWNVLDTTEIRRVLNHLVAKHASDASSAAVRAGAVIGITKIIENPQSHAVLRELLPNIGNLIHDKSEKVRLAVVRLLWHVKESKAGIKFFHIVPPDHLMARLAAETPTNNAVALSLTSLLLKSYFPQNKKSPTNAEHQPGLPLIIVRTLTFLRNDPDAAAVFYANIAKCLEIDVVTAFIVKLWRCMLNAVHIVLQAPSSSTTRSGKHCDNKRRRHNKDQDNEPAPNPNESRTEQQDDLLNATDSELMANLAETICILWKSVESNLDETGRQFLIDAFSGPENFNLTHILDFFEREQQALVLDDDNEERKNHFHRVKAALLQCAGRLPAQEHLVERFTNKIRSESDENTIVSHLALLCLWDRTGDVANSLAVAIRAGLEDASSCEDSFILSPDYNNGRKRQCKTRNRNLDKSPSHGLIELDSMVALKVLDVVLRGADASSTAAREAIFQCADATSTIEATLSQGQFHAERILADMLPPSMSMDKGIDFVLRVCEVFARFILHKCAMQNDCVDESSTSIFCENAARICHWITNRVIPVFARRGVQSLPPFDPDVSSIQIEKSFMLPSTSPPSHAFDRNRQGKRNDANQNVNDKEKKSNFDPLHFDQFSNADEKITNDFAASLLSSTCIIFSEWLAAGGMGDNFIAHAAKEWCKVFDFLSSNDVTSRQILISSFCRLSFQLSKSPEANGSNFLLFKEILVKCNMDALDTGSENNSAVYEVIAEILSMRCNNSKKIVSNVVECVLEAAKECILSGEHPSHEDNDKPELHSSSSISLTEIWDFLPNTGSLRTALEVICSHSVGGIEFGQQLITIFRSCTFASRRHALFAAGCLNMLCRCDNDPESNSGKSIVAAKVVALVRQLVDSDGDGSESEGSLEGMVHHLLQSVNVI